MRSILVLCILLWSNPGCSQALNPKEDTFSFMGFHGGLALKDEKDSPFVCDTGFGNVCRVRQEQLAGLPIAKSFVFFNEKDTLESVTLEFDRSDETEAILLRAFHTKYGKFTEENDQKPLPPFNDDTHYTAWKFPEKKGDSTASAIMVSRGLEKISVTVFFALSWGDSKLLTTEPVLDF